MSEEPKFKRTHPWEGLKHVYADNLATAQGVDGIRLVFGQVVDIELPNTVVIEDRVSVTMSWLELKRVAEILQQRVSAFEAANGPIAAPILPTGDEIPQPKSTPRDLLN